MAGIQMSISDMLCIHDSNIQRASSQLGQVNGQWSYSFGASSEPLQTMMRSQSITADHVITVTVRPQVSPELRIDSASLCRALFEVYLGDSSVVPDAKSAWAQGAKALLATDQSKRGTDKGGAG